MIFQRAEKKVDFCVRSGKNVSLQVKISVWDSLLDGSKSRVNDGTSRGWSGRQTEGNCFSMTSQDKITGP